MQHTPTERPVTQPVTKTPTQTMTTKPFILAASCALLLAKPALAQTPTGWLGDGATTGWSDAANWDNGIPGGLVRSLFFGTAFEANVGGSDFTISNNDIVGYAGHRITFESGSGTAFTITGNGFTLFDFSGAFPRIQNDSTALQTFDLTAGQTLTLDGSGGGGKAEINPVNGNLLFTANTLVDLAGTTQLQIFGGNGNTVTFNGVISSTGNAGNNSVSLNDNSIVVFGAANTYAGDTFVNAGTLRFAAGGSANSSTLRLGDTSGVAAATLELSGGNTLASVVNVRSGSSGLKTILSSAGTNAINGNVFLDADVTVNTTGGALTFGGTTFDLKNQTLTVDGGSNTTITGAIGNSVGTGKLTKNGAGTLTLGGGSGDTTANTFSGQITVGAGTLRLDKAAGTLATASTNLQVNGGTVFYGSGTNLLASNLLPAATNIVVAGGTLNFHSGTGISAANQTLNSLSISSGTLGTTVGTFTNVADLNTITITNAFNVTGGTPTLNSGSTMTAGSFTVSGGTFTIGSNSTIKKTTFAPASVNLNGGTIQMNVGTATGALRGEFVLASDVIVGGSSLTTFSLGGGTATVQPAIILNDAARIFNVADATGTPATDLSINVRVDSGGIRKIGPGAMTLAMTGSPFTGNIAVEGGSLGFQGSGTADQTALGTGAKTVTITNNSRIRIFTTDANPSAGTKTFIVGAGGATFEVDSGRVFTLDDGTVAYNTGDPILTTTAQLQGSGTLTKVGGGNFVAGGGGNFSASFTGSTNLFQGLLTLSNVNGLGNTGTVTVDSTIAAARLNLTYAANAIATDIVVQNGGTLSMTASQNLPNTRTITAAGATAGRIRTDDGAGATASATSRTFVLNGALNGSTTLEIGGTTGATRGVIALSNTQSNISSTIVIDRAASVENHPRFNGTVATTTGKTIGTATIAFAPVFGGSTTDGQLDLRDNGTGNNQTFSYGNNVVMTASGGTIVVGNAVTGAAPVSTGGRFVLGTLALGAGNTITTNTVNAYSLEFGGAATLAGAATFAGTGNLVLSGGTDGGTDVTKNDAGFVTIAPSAGTPYSGNTVINGGGLLFGSGATVGGAGASVTVANGAVFGVATGATQASFFGRVAPTVNTMVFALGANSAANLSLSGYTGARFGGFGTADYSGTLTPDGSTYRLGGGLAGFVLTLSGTNALTGANALDVGTNATGAGTVFLSAANNYSGATTVTGGMTLRAGSNASLGGNASITLDGATLQLANGGDFTAFGTRVLTAGAGGATVHTDGNTVTLGTAIAGAGTFTKTGNGTLMLTNTAATFAGRTIISGGTLSVSADTNLGAVPGAVVTNQVQLLGGTLQSTGTFTIPLNRGVNLGTGGGSIEVTGANTLTMASQMTGSTPFFKEGTGTLLITADPNNSGLYTINGGVLALQHGGSTDANMVVNNTGTLRVVTGGALGDNFSVTVNAGGTFDVRGTETISQLLGTGGIVTNNGGAATTLSVTSTTNATFGGVIQNGVSAIGFTKGNSNTVTFTGANTYTGNTAINTGQLRVEGAAGRLSGGGVVSIGDNNGNDESLIIGNVADVVTGALNRIGDTGQLEFRGSTALIISGPATGSGGFTDTMGDFDFREGVGQVSLIPSSGEQLQLSANALTRELGNGQGVIRGTNLGGTGANSTRVLLTDTTSLVGSGGAGSSASIVPFVIGGTSATAAPGSFLRHDAVNGLTPLGGADYQSMVAGSAGKNVSVAGGETFTGNGGLNALRVTGGVTTLNGGKLAFTSGAVLFTADGTVTGTSTLDVGPRVISLFASADTTPITGTLSANLIGSGGLAAGDAGDVGHTIVVGGNNLFVGGVTVNGGTLRAGSTGAFNASYFNDLNLRAGNSAIGGALSTAIQLGGNSLAFAFGGGDRLHATTRIQNASATPATLTIVTNVASTGNGGFMEDGSGGGALSLIKRGANLLGLDQNNTFSGTTEITQSTLQLTTANGRLSGTSGVTIRGGGVLNLNNTNTANNNDRIPTVPINMHGGQFQYDNNQGTFNYSETVGALNSLNGLNTVVTDFAASGSTATLTFGSLSTGVGAATVITNFGTTGDVGVGEGTLRNRVAFTTDPTTANGIIAGSVFHVKNFTTATTFDPNNFAAYNPDIDGVTAGNQPTVVAFAAYNTGLETGWTNAVVANPALSQTLGGSRELFALKLADGVNVDIGAGQTLNLVGGGLLYNPSGAGPTSTISNGTLTAGGTAPGELSLRSENNLSSANLNITSVIANNTSAAITLLKTGGDTVTLGAANTYTGRTTVAEGVLGISADNNLGAAPGASTAGHLRLHGATLNVTSTMTLNANRGIEVGAASGTIDVRGSSNVLTYNGSVTANGSAAFVVNGERTTSGANVTVADASLAFNAPIDMDGDIQFNLDGTVVLTGVANRIGGLQLGANHGTATLTYGVAGGSLALGGVNPNGTDVSIGYRTIDSGTTVTTISKGTLDLTGSQDLTIKANNVNIGVITGAGSNGMAEGHLVVGTNSSILAGTQVLISSSNGSANGTPLSSDIVFGSGTNSLITPLITVGGQKGKGALSVAAGGTVMLGGFGTGTADLFVARNNFGNTGTVSLGTANFTGGTLVADLDELVVAQKSGTGGNSGGATGTLTLGAGAHVVTANSVRIGDSSGDATGTANGTMNVGGGSVTVSGDVAVASRTGTAGSAVGLLNITGGSVTVGGNITTSLTNTTATLTLNGGILDMTAGTINVDTFNAQTGTLKNVAQLQSGDGATAAALNKNTAGTLTLDGTNTHTAGTNVTAGVLNATANGALGALASPVSISSGATLQAGGVITTAARTVTLGVGGGKIDTNGSTVNLNAGSTVTGSSLEKIGAGTLRIDGTQTYSTLTTTAGTTNINSMLGTGTSTVNANATTNFSSSQTLAALNIGAGAVVTFTSVPPPFAGDGGKLTAGVVPEPGSMALLMVGALGVLGRRRRS